MKTPNNLFPYRPENSKRKRNPTRPHLRSTSPRTVPTLGLHPARAGNLGFGAVFGRPGALATGATGKDSSQGSRN